MNKFTNLSRYLRWGSIFLLVAYLVWSIPTGTTESISEEQAYPASSSNHFDSSFFIFLLLLMVGCWIGPAIGRLLYQWLRTVAQRYARPNWAILIAFILAAGLCLVGVITCLGAVVAVLLYWEDINKLAPIGHDFTEERQSSNYPS